MSFITNSNDTESCLLYNVNNTCSLRFISTIKSQCEKCKKNAEIKCDKILTINISEKKLKSCFKDYALI